MNVSQFPSATVTDAGVVSKVIQPDSGYSGIAIQAVVEKNSGTLGGTIKIYGSLDGANYEQIDSDYTVTDTATQAKMFYVSAPLPAFIKVEQTGTGVMSATLTVYFRFDNARVY